MDIVSHLGRVSAMAGMAICHVSLSAPRAGRYAALTISWSGGAWVTPERDKATKVVMSAWERTPDLTIFIPVKGWRDAEAMAMVGSWESGAWDIARFIMPPLPLWEDWRNTSHGIVSAFGGRPYEADGDCAPSDVCAAAADLGWVAWHWRPVLYGMSYPAPADKTVDAYGGRRSADMPPYRPGAPSWDHGQMTVVRYGRANHPNRAKRQASSQPETDPPVSQAKLAYANRIAAVVRLPVPTSRDAIDRFIDTHKHALDRIAPTPTSKSTNKTPPVERRGEPVRVIEPRLKPKQSIMVVVGKVSKGERINPGDGRIASTNGTFSGGVVTGISIYHKMCGFGQWRGHLITCATIDPEL